MRREIARARAEENLFGRGQESSGSIVVISIPMISLLLPALARGSAQELTATCARNPEVDS